MSFRVAESGLLLDPSATVLLAVDFQPSVLERLKDSEEVVARAAAAISTAREYGVAVAFVTVGLTPDERGAVPDTNVMFARARDSGSMPANTRETSVDERMSPQDGDIVLRKRRVGALATTELDEVLRARGIDTVLLCGVHTSGCVLSTIRDAADRDYRVVVLRDGCADPDPVVHALLLDELFPRQGLVLLIDEVAGLLAG